MDGEDFGLFVCSYSSMGERQGNISRPKVKIAAFALIPQDSSHGHTAHIVRKTHAITIYQFKKENINSS